MPPKLPSASIELCQQDHRRADTDYLPVVGTSEITDKKNALCWFKYEEHGKGVQNNGLVYLIWPRADR